MLENAYALVVGISDYSQSPTFQEKGLTRLSTARKGAEAMAKALTAQGYQVKPLYDAEADSVNLVSAIKELFENRKPADLLLLYFAGHGYPIEEDIFLAPSDFDEDSRKKSGQSLAKLREEYFAKAIQKVVLILDCCYSGAFFDASNSSSNNGNHRLTLEDVLWHSFRGTSKFSFENKVLFAATGSYEQSLDNSGGDGYSHLTEKILPVLQGQPEIIEKVVDEEGRLSSSRLVAYLEESYRDTKTFLPKDYSIKSSKSGAEEPLVLGVYPKRIKPSTDSNATSPASRYLLSPLQQKQEYLRRLIDQVGWVDLAQIVPEQASRIELENVYVDSPTFLALSIEVENWQIKDWWLNRTDQPRSEIADVRLGAGFGLEEKERMTVRPRPKEFGFHDAPFEKLINELAKQIAAYHAENPKLNPNEKYSLYRNRWNNGIHQNVKNLHLQDIAVACDQLVILGAPGSGKSSFVRYLALCLAGAKREHWKRQANLTNLEEWTHGELTPIYIELRRFVDSAYFPEIAKDAKTKTKHPTASDLWRYIEQEVLGEDLREYAAELKIELEQGQVLLILDGLDEVPYPEGKLKARQEQLKSLMQSIEVDYSECRIIVTSRPYAYIEAEWKLLSFSDISIAAFEDEHRQELVSRLYQAVKLSPQEANAKAEKLNEELRPIDGELKDRPLFVTLMATLFLRRGAQGLPTRKGELYRESIMLLLERWTQSKGGGKRSLLEILGDDRKAEDLYKQLAALAYTVHETSGEMNAPCEIGLGLLLEHLYLGDFAVKELVPYLNENAGLLLSPGQSEKKKIFQFAHRSFQEYLAAEYLVEKCKEADNFKLIRQHIEEKPQLWRVPGAFVGDVLTDTDRPSDLWRLLGDLLEEDPPITANDGRWWSGWLAATIAQEQKLDEPAKGLIEKSIQQALRLWLMKLLETPQALPPVERAMCGRVLSKLGDPRKGVGTTKIIIKGREIEIPEIEWLPIPAPDKGEFTMGADGQDDNPRHQEKLDYSFKIAKYPITYQQYQTFIDSGDYDNPDWWLGFPKEYQPDLRDEQEFKYDNHPRERVKWYQAMAFSRWLTACYREAKLSELSDGLEIRLPTEIEWEYAARGSDARQYPWGNEFDETKANTNETDINQTSAVGSYPDGASPFEVLDMSGNVWEWCLNEYSKNTGARVLRGGSWSGDPDDAACAYRNNNNPNNRNNNIGFRLVVGSHTLLSLRRARLRGRACWQKWRVITVARLR